MHDMTREQLHKLVYQLLAEPLFQQRLTKVAADGTRPIVLALRGDRMTNVLAELEARGGCGTLVAPAQDGVVMLPMTRTAQSVGTGDSFQIAGNCTVGVFLERVAVEGPGRYAFAQDDQVESG